jgi:oligopeptide transport system substrate-binding protein
VQIGGVFRVNEVMDIRSLYPLEITEVNGFRVASQVYESMVRFDQATLEPIPGLAESWEANENATEWTFRLRKGVKFHDDPCFSGGKGRELNAEDIKYCFEQLCTPSSNNQMFWLVKERLRGAHEYYKAKLNGDDDASLECIDVIDEYTVKIKLNFPFASFLRLMGHNAFYIYPKEAVEAYGDQMTNKAIGTGPFYLKVFQRDELLVLQRNEGYWGVDDFGNSLPYLNAIQVSFVKDKKTELLSFKNGDLDMIFTLPIDMYGEVMGSLDETNGKDVMAYRPQVMPSLSGHYYAFQHHSELFKDVRIRKAFNLAVDKKSLVE